MNWSLFVPISIGLWPSRPQCLKRPEDFFSYIMKYLCIRVYIVGLRTGRERERRHPWRLAILATLHRRKLGVFRTGAFESMTAGTLPLFPPSFHPLSTLTLYTSSGPTPARATAKPGASRRAALLTPPRRPSHTPLCMGRGLGWRATHSSHILPLDKGVRKTERHVFIWCIAAPKYTAAAPANCVHYGLIEPATRTDTRFDLVAKGLEWENFGFRLRFRFRFSGRTLCRLNIIVPLFSIYCSVVGIIRIHLTPILGNTHTSRRTNYKKIILSSDLCPSLHPLNSLENHSSTDFIHTSSVLLPAGPIH